MQNKIDLPTSSMVHYHLAGKVTSEEYAICERLLGVMACNMLIHLLSNCDTLSLLRRHPLCDSAKLQRL